MNSMTDISNYPPDLYLSHRDAIIAYHQNKRFIAYPEIRMRFIANPKMLMRFLANVNSVQGWSKDNCTGESLYYSGWFATTARRVGEEDVTKCDAINRIAICDLSQSRCDKSHIQDMR